MDIVTFLVTYMFRLNNYLEEHAYCKPNCDDALIVDLVTAKGVDAIVKTDLDFSYPGKPGWVLADGDSAAVLTNVKGFEIYVAQNGIFAKNRATGQIVTHDGTVILAPTSQLPLM
jgi:hypothetical protein